MIGLLGPPKGGVVFGGDWVKRRRTKFQGPVPTKRLWRVLKSAGYLVFMVKEHFTSQACSSCKTPGVKVEQHWRWVKNPRFYQRKKRPYVLCHGLVRCLTCGGMFCRDVNAANNIEEVVVAALAGKPRPAYLCS